jgi:hypothetical protein
MDEWATLAAKTLKGILYYKETFKNELKETFLKFINDDNKAWKAQQDLLACKKILLTQFKEFDKEESKGKNE